MWSLTTRSPRAARRAWIRAACGVIATWSVHSRAKSSSSDDMAAKLAARGRGENPSATAGATARPGRAPPRSRRPGAGQPVDPLALDDEALGALTPQLGVRSDVAQL